MEDLNKKWPHHIMIEMVEKSEGYENPRIYQYGYYDGYQKLNSKINESHVELKRLQKEIDEAVKNRSDLDILKVCFGDDLSSNEQYKSYSDIIEECQLKIKQIIEEL